jgi:hypothetical protein
MSSNWIDAAAHGDVPQDRIEGRVEGVGTMAPNMGPAE